MKKILLLFFVILCSCNNSSKSESALEAEKVSDIEIAAEEPISKPNFNELSIIQEKLQDAYDIIYLYNTNPDFEAKKLKSTLQNNLNLDSLQLSNIPKISNLHQIKPTKIINDSISHINFTYTFISETLTQTDTLQAIITKKKITIDGVTSNSIKVDFTQL